MANCDYCPRFTKDTVDSKKKGLWECIKWSDGYPGYPQVFVDTSWENPPGEFKNGIRACTKLKEHLRDDHGIDTSVDDNLPLLLRDGTEKMEENKKKREKKRKNKNNPSTKDL